jgi:mRNA-degrading endonuclease HigB of HigAB toxin-antitoxin module
VIEVTIARRGQLIADHRTGFLHTSPQERRASRRQTFPSADPVRVASGRTVIVFNIARTRYRLITAIHYNMRKVFVLRFLTHAKYDRETWKDKL